MDMCLGSVIAVDCGSEGYYQGKLTELDLESPSKGVILSNVFKDGVPCGRIMRLDVQTIKSLKVLKAVEPPSKAAEPEPVKKPKKASQNKEISPKPKEPSVGMKGNGKHIKWVNRPLKTELSSAQDLTSSSDIDSRSSMEAKPKVIPKKKTRAGRKKELQAVSVQTIESTPTPLFKRFEPQVPKPQSLSAPAWAVKSVRKGPCGIPILDVQNGYGPISRRDAHLDNPIDFEELEQDFDFATNLRLFDKDNVESGDENYYTMIEKQKMSKNFKHDENILSDPSRITSWTNVSAKNCYSADELPASSNDKNRSQSPTIMSFCPSSFETMSNGSRIPCLDASVKVKYLKSCRSYLGAKTYSTVVADRLLMYFNDIVSLENLGSSLTIALLSHSTTEDIATCFSSRLADRGHSVSIHGSCGEKLPTTCIRALNRKMLPAEPDLIVCLHPKVPAELLSYIEAHQNAHILILESRLPITMSPKVHTLLLGVFTTGFCDTPAPLIIGKTTFAALCGAISKSQSMDCRIADIGAPFDWIVSGGKEALRAVFSKEILVQK